MWPLFAWNLEKRYLPPTQRTNKGAHRHMAVPRTPTPARGRGEGRRRGGGRGGGHLAVSAPLAFRRWAPDPRCWLRARPRRAPSLLSPGAHVASSSPSETRDSAVISPRTHRGSLEPPWLRGTALSVAPLLTPLGLSVPGSGPAFAGGADRPTPLQRGAGRPVLATLEHPARGDKESGDPE